jgi:hypothetical protein
MCVFLPSCTHAYGWIPWRSMQPTCSNPSAIRALGAGTSKPAVGGEAPPTAGHFDCKSSSGGLVWQWVRGGGWGRIGCEASRSRALRVPTGALTAAQVGFLKACPSGSAGTTAGTSFCTTAPGHGNLRHSHKRDPESSSEGVNYTRQGAQPSEPDTSGGVSMPELGLETFIFLSPPPSPAQLHYYSHRIRGPKAFSWSRSSTRWVCRNCHSCCRRIVCGD